VLLHEERNQINKFIVHRAWACPIDGLKQEKKKGSRE